MKYFKEQFLPDVSKALLAVLSGLLVFLGTSLIKKSSETKGDFLYSFGLSPFLNIALYIVYVFLFVYFTWKIIQRFRAVCVSYIDYLQDDYIEPHPAPTRVMYDDYALYQNYEAFMFRVRYGNLNRFTPDFLISISNPRCPDNECGTDLSVRRSYLGFYKYRCPGCSKKYLSKYSQNTLKAGLKSIVLRKNEKLADESAY